MGGNIRTVLLLLGANADPTLPNKVRHLDLKDDMEKQTEHKQITSACKLFLMQNNELPADLTKSDRILKVLHPKILNGDSWWPPQTPCLHACLYHTDDVCWGEEKTTAQCQIYSTTICTVHGACLWLRLKWSCHMLNKPGLNLEQHNVQPKCICPPCASPPLLRCSTVYAFIFLYPRCCKISIYFAHFLFAFLIDVIKCKFVIQSLSGSVHVYLMYEDQVILFWKAIDVLIFILIIK